MAERDASGRFLKGHVGLKGGGRPLGVANKFTQSLRDEVRAGLGDVTTFVKELKQHSPAAAAGLLARLMPPEGEPESAGFGPVTINILSVSRGDRVSIPGTGEATIVSNEAAEAAWRARNPELQLAGPQPAPLEADKPEGPPTLRVVVDPDVVVEAGVVIERDDPGAA
jgi:hypothetical protein